MISHSKKFIFIHIPGTAGTSIEHALEEYQSGELIRVGGGIWTPDSETKQKIANLFGVEMSENPKHMTAIQWKQVLGEKYDEYYKFTIVRNPFDKAVSLFKFNKIKPKEQEEWVIKQMLFIKDENGDVIVDDVFKFEELSDSWRTICEKINIEYKPLPHINNRNKQKETINSLLKPNEIIELNELLDEDFVELNYR